MLQFAGRYLIETQPILDRYSTENQPVSWSISDCHISAIKVSGTMTLQ